MVRLLISYLFATVSFACAVSDPIPVFSINFRNETEYSIAISSLKLSASKAFGPIQLSLELPNLDTTLEFEITQFFGEGSTSYFFEAKCRGERFTLQLHKQFPDKNSFSQFYEKRNGLVQLKQALPGLSVVDPLPLTLPGQGLYFDRFERLPADLLNLEMLWIEVVQNILDHQQAWPPPHREKEWSGLFKFYAETAFISGIADLHLENIAWVPDRGWTVVDVALFKKTGLVYKYPEHSAENLVDFHYGFGNFYGLIIRHLGLNAENITSSQRQWLTETIQDMILDLKRTVFVRRTLPRKATLPQAPSVADLALFEMARSKMLPADISGCRNFF